SDIRRARSRSPAPRRYSMQTWQSLLTNLDGITVHRYTVPTHQAGRAGPQGQISRHHLSTGLGADLFMTGNAPRAATQMGLAADRDLNMLLRHICAPVPMGLHLP